MQAVPKDARACTAEVIGRCVVSAVRLIGRVLTALVAIPGLLFAYAALTALRLIAEWITGDAEDWR